MEKNFFLGKAAPEPLNLGMTSLPMFPALFLDFYSFYMDFCAVLMIFPWHHTLFDYSF